VNRTFQKYAKPNQMIISQWKKNLLLFFILLFILILMGSCTPRPSSKLLSDNRSPEAPVKYTQKTFSDALNRQYTQEYDPRRIVSLVPAVTEILFAIGAGDRVVGVTQQCDYPDEAKTRVSVGAFSDASVSMDRIRSLTPDLVILSADMHSGIISLLDSLDIPSFAVEPRNLSQVYDVISLIGDITGYRSGAEAEVAEMKRQIFGVEKQIQGHEPRLVFWIISDDPLSSAGGETLVSEAIRLSGGKNIFDDLKEQWPLVSPEQVVSRKPDIIIQGNNTGSGSRGNNSFREIRTVVVSTDMFRRYGPSLADDVELLAKILHSSD